MDSPQHKHSPLSAVLGIVLAASIVVAGVVAVRILTATPPQKATTARWANATVEDVDASHLVYANSTNASDERNGTAENNQTNATSANKTDKKKHEVSPATIDAMMIGDVLMHDELVDSGYQQDGGYWFGFLFDHIRSYIDEADLRMLNQETVMGEPERGYHLTVGEVGPVMNTPTALADTEVDYGFNLILKSTNHVLDLGHSGLAHELDYWKDAHPNMPVVGVSNPHAESRDDSQNYVDNVYIYEHDGLKVGILNYTYDTNNHYDWDLDAQYVSYLSEDKIRDDVQKARDAGAEMLIACPHWGIQYDTTPSHEEYTYAKLFCDLGVDVIFGCHPHILQPVVMLRNAEGHKTVCFYSMGNFVAAGGMETDTLVGGVARVTLQRDKNGTCSVSAASLVPTVCCYTVGPNMSAWPITEWTYDLAAQSVRSNLTPDHAYAFCSEVLGDGFDPNTGVFTLNMDDEGIEL
ncbi:MAG: CapA family protein [Atopobiaceae bacterium]|nr:CapA family protein [Atopobiaceae bacterium]